ncbi:MULTISPECIES: hypothetical protein [Flavobacterium]|uniref:DUF4468 domain-containing protein n=1 Tax=Flavobacterium jumunjinense TaxID=998845 RepID=A0ABV5GRF1_9FLAO|nr:MULTISPECIES: hypothetical protein [Flavobacterium]
MKNLLQSITLLYSIFAFSQNISEINANLKISDSLTNQKEIRIYKKEGTTNYSELLHLYFENEKWEAVQYKYYTSTNFKSPTKIQKILLKTDEDLELAWIQILATNIEFLPNQSEIEYKLRGKLEIDRLTNGEYEYSYKKTLAIDGTNYLVMVKNYNKRNKVTFDNPERYLKLYPNVDELIDFCNLLKIINSTFSTSKTPNLKY